MKLINLNKFKPNVFFSNKNSQSKIIDNISFDIQIGSINIIIGPNGAGKTTLSKLIAQIDKDYQGKIENSFSNIGYLPQFVFPNPNLPINVNYLINLMNDKTHLSNDKERYTITKNLISKLDNAQINNLSGGNFRKLLLFLILSQNYDLIVLDEPNQNLDFNGENLFYKIILELKLKFNVTFVIISHAIHAVMKYADNIICMDKHICCHGKPGDLINNNEFLALYSHIHNCN